MGKAKRCPLEDPHKKDYPSPGDYIIPGFSDLIMKKYNTEMTSSNSIKPKKNVNESIKEDSSKLTSVAEK